LLFKPNDKVGCSAGKIHPHIDTRGKGGYIIWWPAEGLEVLHADVLAEVPDWVTSRLRPSTAAARVQQPLRCDADLDPLLGVILRAKEGERNTATFWAACRLAEHVHAGQLSDGDMIDLVVVPRRGTDFPSSKQERLRTARFAVPGLQHDRRQCFEAARIHCEKDRSRRTHDCPDGFSHC
jgi:hypothetical protein